MTTIATSASSNPTAHLQSAGPGAAQKAAPMKQTAEQQKDSVKFSPQAQAVAESHAVARHQGVAGQSGGKR